jgi:hypothetical protein
LSALSCFTAIAGARALIPKITANIAIAAIVYVVFINELKEETNDILDAVCSEQFLGKKMSKDEGKGI